MLDDLLTIAIPAKNEERNLPECLESVAAFRRVVVVDSGSDDRTPEIAASHGREVVRFRWDGRFPKKRNWFLRNYAFETPWVMFLDADERLTPAFVAELERTLPATRCDAFICFYDNWFMGRMLCHGDAMRKTAILRVGAGEYERIDERAWSGLDMEIHEHIQVRGEIGVMKAHLEHHDMRSLESHRRKHLEYAAWEANRCAALGGSFASLTRRQKIKYSCLRRWWFAPAYFCASYFLKGGFLDGRPGFAFAREKWRYFADIRRRLNAMPPVALTGARNADR